MKEKNTTIVALRMYRLLEQQIRMKNSQLSLLETGLIKTSRISDEVGGEKKSIYDQYDDLMVKKEALKLEVLDLELRKSAIDEALTLMTEGDEVMREAKEALFLKHVEHKSAKVIQAKLNMSSTTLKRRLAKAEKEFIKLFDLSKYEALCEIY